MPRRTVALFLVATLAAGVAYGQLNPTVKVLPKPRTAVPPGCEEGLAAARPRIVAETAPPAPRYEPPPPRDTETPVRLRALQRAAQGNDYRAFQEALAAARAAHVPQSELQKYEDIDRVWTYAQTSPTGAFFESSDDLMSVMRKYPSYPRAIADATVTVGGKTLYPTRETRLFLAGERTTAGRAGVPPAGSAASRRRGAPSAQPTRPKHHRRVHKAEGAGETPAHQPARTPARRVHVASATATHPTRRSAPAPKVVAPPVTTTTATAPSPVTTTTAATTAPTTTSAPATTAPTTTTVAATTTTTTTTTTTPPTTTTVAPTPPPAPVPEPATNTIPTTPAKQEHSNANIIVAIILVIVGVGLAILLFRASD